jgi:hypothetical protein
LEIIKLAVPNYATPNPHTTLWVLAHVCRIWRKLILDTRSLWSRIEIDLWFDPSSNFGPPIRALRELLNRSKGYPLSVSFRARGKEQELLLAVDYALDLVFSHSERCQTLRLDLQCPHFSRLSKTPRLPGLQNLTILGHELHGTTPTLRSFAGWELPKLQYLSLKSISGIHCLRVPWEDLKEFKTWDCPLADVLSLPSLNSVTEYAAVDPRGWPSRSYSSLDSAFALPQVHSLGIVSSHVLNVLKMLPRSLQILSLRNTDVSAFLSLVKRCTHNLEIVELQFLDHWMLTGPSIIHSQQTYELLFLLPSLTTLTIGSDFAGLKEYISFLTPVFQPLVPKLSTLTFITTQAGREYPSPVGEDWQDVNQRLCYLAKSRSGLKEFHFHGIFIYPAAKGLAPIDPFLDLEKSGLTVSVSFEVSSSRVLSPWL